MTIDEAIAARVARVRLPNWNPGAYLQFHLLPDGMCGPWVILHDPCSGQPDANIIITELLSAEDRYVAANESPDG